MTTSEIDPPKTGSEEEAVGPDDVEAVRTGKWSPDTPPPSGAPTGNWSPNTPPPSVVPTGNWSPNTPPPANGVAPQPGNGSGGSVGSTVLTGTITQLWSSSAGSGVWVLVHGLGWKRLAASESGRGALTTLALLARVHGLPVSFHQDAIGQIDELLV